MMKLADASSYFDLTQATEPTTGAKLFKGQIGNYDDSKRDSAAAYRRVLSVRPGTSMPGAAAVRMLGRVWLIGNMEPDGLGELHREKYVLQEATTQLKVSRLNQFLSGTQSSTLWAAPGWIKDAKQLEVSSETPQIYDIEFARGSDVRVHDVVWDSNAAYLVLSPRPVSSGFLCGNSLKLDYVAPVSATLVTRAYNPVTGTYTTSGTVTLNALPVRWQSLFEYGSQASERYQEGDITIVLPTGTVVTNASRVSIGAVNYQVLAVLDASGAVGVHARVA